MTKVVGVNGIWTNGEGNIDRLLADVERRGIRVVDPSLPKRGPFGARFGGRHDGAIVSRYSSPGDILVAHSFGAIRAWYAHKLCEYKAIIVIAPAQGSGTEWWNPGRVWCYHSPGDWIVELGALLLFHPFGRAGTKGYTQAGVHNVECDSDHNDYFVHLELREEIVDLIELIYHADLGARYG